MARGGAVRRERRAVSKRSRSSSSAPAPSAPSSKGSPRLRAGDRPFGEGDVRDRRRRPQDAGRAARGRRHRSDVALDDLIKQRAVIGPRTDIARAGVGVGVREGAPKPDISTPDAFKQAILGAKSIVYVDPAQGATSGIHFAGVLQRLGIADAVKSKTILWPGGYAAEAVQKGQADLVVHQISEILPVKGVTLVGPLPGDLQKITIYAAGLASRARRRTRRRRSSPTSRGLHRRRSSPAPGWTTDERAGSRHRRGERDRACGVSAAGA